MLETFGNLRTPPTYDVAKLLDRFEGNAVMARTPMSIDQSPQVVLALLVDLTFILHAIAADLHGELIDRHRLDGRWRASRRRFLLANDLECDDGLWPF